MKTKLVCGFSVAVIALGLGTACAPKKKFGASVPEATAVKETAKPKTSDGASKTPADAGIPGPSNNPVCKEGKVGLTSAELLTSGIKENTTGQIVKYALSVISCKDGSVIPLKNQRIWFDLNARGTYEDISYNVSSSSRTLIGKGSLEIKKGSDLFGNEGDYAHWETQDLSYDTSNEKLILEVRFGETTFRSLDGQTIESYLRIGDSQAVQKDLAVLK